MAQAGDVVAIESPTYFWRVAASGKPRRKTLEIPTHPVSGVSLEALELATRHGQVSRKLEVLGCLADAEFSNRWAAPGDAREPNKRAWWRCWPSAISR